MNRKVFMTVAYYWGRRLAFRWFTACAARKADREEAVKLLRKMLIGVGLVSPLGGLTLTAIFNYIESQLNSPWDEKDKSIFPDFMSRGIYQVPGIPPRTLPPVW